MIAFLSGMIVAGYLIAVLFFVRFWRRTGDSLFAIFGLSFLLLAIGQSLSVSFTDTQDDNSWVYLLRLAGFGLLLVAILVKNLGATKR